MNIFRPGFVFLTILTAGYAAVAAPANAAPASRPNVLLIVADDLGFSDIGPYGGEISTPNLDRLASEGMRFTQFYNCAVCVMTRAALYSGLFPRPGKGGLLRNNTVTLGEALRPAGYFTVLTGKWHLGSEAPHRPIDRGFDEYYGVLSGCCDYFSPAKPDPYFYNDGGNRRIFAHNDQLITEFPADYYTTNAFSDHAADMIRRAAKSNRPFFINLCYTAPHFPLHALAEDVARQRGKYRDGYDKLRARRFQRQIELGIVNPAVTKLSNIDPKTGTYRYEYQTKSWDQLDQASRQREEERMEVYAAMVDRLDQGIGRVLSALDETGLAKNTVVFFLSDNGGCTRWSENNAKEMAGFIEYNRGVPVGDGRGYEFVGPSWGWAQNAPFRHAKTWTYEGGLCTPMIVRWPGVVKAGAITHQQGHVIDFLPTLLQLANRPYPEKNNGEKTPALEGRSLIPILRGGTAEPRQVPLAWELYGNRAIRDGDWKLVWGASDRRWELYNLATDRSETTDLSGKYPDRSTKMAAGWEQWAKRTGVVIK